MNNLKKELDNTGGWATALQGFGAGVAGRGTEFLQGLDDARSNALVKDAYTTQQHLLNGNVPDALALLNNRVELLGDRDNKDTQGIIDLIGSGNIQGAVSELQIPIDYAIGLGKFKPPQIAEATPKQQIVNGQLVTITEDGAVATDIKGLTPENGEDLKKEKTRAEIKKLKAETKRILESEMKQLRKDGSLSPDDAAIIKQERIKTTENNVSRIAELSQGQSARASSTAKARRFLKAFEEGRATSGTTRAFVDFIPGVYTEQGQFDEEFDSFAEVAARAKLKSLGETKPTDADVAGMKRSMFSPFRDETTNIQLLRDFITDQEQLDDELEELNRAKEAGNLSAFTGVSKSSQTPLVSSSRFQIEVVK